ncbi:MAG TPA: bifunctional DNA primase/polymerase [Candidatus Binatus sp.]|nr:bifunctional DNA primase/polymerase [Candidatus Binatus sp.]
MELCLTTPERRKVAKNSTVLEAAQTLTARGYSVTPVRYRSKAPILPGWQKLPPLTHEQLPQYFSNGSNIGLRTGIPPHFLADVDLDCPEAVTVAGLIRGPETGRVFGRDSNPKSHFLFAIGAPFETRKFAAPGSKKTILELRGAPLQTVIPPSVHPSGEQIAWVREADFGRSTETDLRRFCCKVAVAVSLSLKWPPEGQRHDGVFAISGVFHRAGLTLDVAIELVSAAAQVAGDKKVRERERAVRNTYKRLDGGNPATGIPSAVKLFGEKTISFVIVWLADICPPPTPAIVAAGPTAPEWPEPMEPEAFIGIAGDFVRLVEPHTEADPAALLANFLVFSGVFFGREAWAVADAKKHYPVEFALITGATGSGRKGTATNRVLEVFERVDPFFDRRILSGLSSGEGLIKGVSATEGGSEVRTYLVSLPEFASLLSVMTRQGNTMSAVMREAWDCLRLRALTRKEALDAQNVNVSVVGHVTPEELLNNLTATDRANGFANRFLVFLVKRSKLLPEGGGDVNLEGIALRLHAAVAATKGRGQLQRDAAARELWRNEYPRLTTGRDGIRGALCGRAEAHVLRLSLLYALLDSESSIRCEHLRAALAVWDYCERSVDTIFGASSGDPEKDKILGALAAGAMTMRDLHRVFANNRDQDWIRAKMAALVRSGRITETVKDGSAKKTIRAWELKS